MKYLITECGFIYAYDDETNFTFVFKEGKWEVSKVIYMVIEWDERDHLDYLTENEVLEITGGLSVYDKIAEVKAILNGNHRHER